MLTPREPVLPSKQPGALKDKGVVVTKGSAANVSTRSIDKKQKGREPAVQKQGGEAASSSIKNTRTLCTQDRSNQGVAKPSESNAQKHTHPESECLRPVESTTESEDTKLTAKNSNYCSSKKPYQKDSPGGTSTQLGSALEEGMFKGLKLQQKN